MPVNLSPIPRQHPLGESVKLILAPTGADFTGNLSKTFFLKTCKSVFELHQIASQKMIQGHGGVFLEPGHFAASITG